MARIVASAQHSQAPMEFTTAPIEAVHKVLDKAGLTLDDIDLFEVNEAFAVVALAAQDALGIPSEKLNVRGGSVAVGHPIGATRRPHPDDAAARDEGDRGPLRARGHLHRRRRGDGDHRRAWGVGRVRRRRARSLHRSSHSSSTHHE